MAKKETEHDKAAGKTEAQLANRAYHDGKFQTHDPVTGEKRGPMMYHRTPEAQTGPIGDENPWSGPEGPDATDSARELAQDEGIPLSSIRGTGAGGRITVEDVRAAKQG